MTEERKPHQSPDGTHVYPLSQVRRFYETEGGGNGEMRWSLYDGLTFRFELPLTSAPPVLGRNHKEGGGVGALQKAPKEPEWIACLEDSSTVEIFFTEARETKEIGLGARNGSGKLVVAGRANSASVILKRDSPLALWYDTPTQERLYFVGLNVMLRWPIEEPVEQPFNGGMRRRLRGKIILSETPALTVYCGSDRESCVDPTWLTYPASKDTDPLWYDDICGEVRGFVSFLIGRYTPFLWRDTFLNGQQLRRVYFGWHVTNKEITHAEQPVPLGRTCEAIRHGADIARMLPTLFEQYLALRPSYDVEWIISPLWSAYQGFIDEKLAQACISLERLVAAHDDYLKKSGVKLSKTYLTPRQSSELLGAFKKVLAEIGEKENISAATLTILTKKLDNLHQPPNSEKHEQVFQDLGIILTDQEKKVLRDRNKCFHGKPTMTADRSLQSMDDEMRRFDILRTLLHRGVLALLHYDGQYLDYGARPGNKNFPTVKMTTKAAP